jgi:osmotically-inducible protein OsmY
MYYSKYILTITLISLPMMMSAVPLAYANEEAGQSNTGHEVDESGITMSVMAKYALDSEIGPFKLQVYTNGSTVSLAGELQSESQYSKAILLAASVKDVTNVDTSKLTVKQTVVSLSDLRLAAMVRGNLLRNAVFNDESTSAWPITIEVTEDEINVTGTVSTESEKEHILDVIRSTQGASNIDDEIGVQADDLE